MSEITYLLGAGASYYSMPLVENFSERFGIFMAFLRNNEINSQDDIIKKCEHFIEEVNVHLSFDTYFKKLFHQRASQDISKSKNLLLLYFIFEHLADRKMYASLRVGNSLSKDKKFNIDPRYDALIAGLIKPLPGKNDFYTKVNFVTWNYDLNLLMAHKNFHLPEEDISDYIKSYNFSENEFKFENDISICHMNGFINHPRLDSGKALNQDELVSLFNILIDQYYSPEQRLSTYSNSINFCWETVHASTIQPLFIKNAIDAINRSSHVIIIGYSFPLYNRIYDQLLFTHKNLERTKIIIQNPDSETSISDFRIIFNFPQTFSNTKEAPQFSNYDNCKSFYVPNDIIK